VKFHPHGSVIASAGCDNSIKLFDLRSAQCIQHYTAHDAAVTGIDFHPSGDFLLSGSEDASLKIWDLREGHQLYTIHGHKGATLGVNWSLEGDFFASAGADQRVMTWATNFDRVLDAAEPTFAQRRQRVQIRPSSAEKLSREQYEGSETTRYAPEPLANPQFEHHQQQLSQPRTIVADTLPQGYTSRTSAAHDGIYQPPQTAGAVAQPQPHPQLSVAHDCAYDHEHTLPNGSHHGYHSSEQPEQKVERLAPGAASVLARHTLPANHATAFQPPADAPVQPLAADPAEAGPRLLSSAGASLSAVRLPDSLTQTLHHIVTQLDVISRTMRSMEERLEMHETKMDYLEKNAVVRERNEQHERVLEQQRRDIGAQHQQQQQHPHQQ
jgi:hypothetical protein